MGEIVVTEILGNAGHGLIGEGEGVFGGIDAGADQVVGGGIAVEAAVDAEKAGLAQIHTGGHLGHRPRVAKGQKDLAAELAEALLGGGVEGDVVFAVAGAGEFNEQLLGFEAQQLGPAAFLGEEFVLHFADQIGDEIGALGMEQGVGGEIQAGKKRLHVSRQMDPVVDHPLAAVEKLGRTGAVENTGMMRRGDPFTSYVDLDASEKVEEGIIGMAVLAVDGKACALRPSMADGGDGQHRNPSFLIF